MLFCVFTWHMKSEIKRAHYEKTDVYYIWQEGQRICRGENPYSRMDKENLLETFKPPPYFPAFYLFECAASRLGLNSFDKWIPFWRVLVLVFHLGIAMLYWLYFRGKNELLLGLFFTGLWLFNRWSMGYLWSLQINSMTLFPLIAGMMVLPKYRKAATLLIGLSISFKQISIFLVPLFPLLELINHPSLDRAAFKAAAKSLVFVLLIPTLLCLPFLVWDFDGFVRAMQYQATRPSSGHGSALGYLISVPPMVMMGIAMTLVYWGAYRARLKPATTAMLVMLCFISFNTVFFSPYFLWFLALLPLAVAEWLKPHSEKA